MSEQTQKVVWLWRGECVRCRHIWWSKSKPKRCPRCGFTHAIMKNRIPFSEEEYKKIENKIEGEVE